MNSYMHFMHPPKIAQIGWGHHVDFCVWKKSAITFGEGCSQPPYGMFTGDRVTVISVQEKQSLPP